MDGAGSRAGHVSAASLARLFHTPSLLYFVSVAETLSMRETARRLNIASSAVARQIGHLEETLGFKLFSRERRRLRLTPAGEILLRHARELTHPLEAAVSELDLLAGLQSGSVRIATVESVGLSILPRLIAEFGRRYPRLKVETRVAPASDVVELVAAGEADMGFAFLARATRHVEIAVRRDLPIGVVIRSDHPLAAAQALSFADCFAHPCAVPARGLSIREVIDPFLVPFGDLPRSVVEANSVRMLYELARSGHYAAFLTPLGIEREIMSGEVLFRPLTERGLPLNRFGMIVRSQSSLRFAPAAFFDMARIYFDTAGNLSEFPAGP
ncbi:transcriptional regulator [Kaistia algarum]|uniref:LysR family transcriptional regulator n=1 Tax=Kaistia algarum TaxID=2083279 RepID=UPI000CE750FA|nr:LysR family transcriptional regulator [Kaistia algarum]MCX5514828.1 LysR family transcriptional regulator [Kaistia algarum]PPE79587.1 transcriptional regulator [Kaistia algarum]